MTNPDQHQRGVDGVAPNVAASVDGAGEGELHLSDEMALDGFADGAFVADLVNRFFAEGRPAELTGVAVDAGEVSAAATWAYDAADHLSVSGELDFDGMAFGDAEHDSLLAELRGHPATVRQGESEAFYFLASSPPAPPATPAAQAPKPDPRPAAPFPVEAIRQDFPILHQKVHGRPLIWMDNAATTQKPRAVIEAISRFYERDNSNVHRGQHTLAVRATDLYEGARDKVRRFLGASAPEEIVFTHGATEAINLVAQTFGRAQLRKGDEIVLSTLEHHANIVPWQQLVQETGAVLRVIPVNDRGEILLEEYERLLGPRTRMVALSHVSNAVGTILPVRAMTRMAHRHGARVLLDGAQAVPHMTVDVQALDCDFYVVAGHKLFGPTGIGVLYGKRELLEAMPPWQGGGNMMEEVTFEHTTYRRAPARFEAGTAILAGAIGLGAALDYLDDLGMDQIARYDQELLAYATPALSAIPGLRLIGTAAEKVGVLSFILDGVSPEAVGRHLDREGIAVRVGRHCAHPTMRRFGVPGTIRPSLAFYNTHAEIDALVAAIARAKAGT